MIEVYKIMTRRERIDGSQFFKVVENEHNLRGHTLKLRKEYSRLDIRKYCFGRRVLDGWNRLPQHIVDATSVNQFKNLLDKHWNDMDITSSRA